MDGWTVLVIWVAKVLVKCQYNEMFRLLFTSTKCKGKYP